MLFQNVGHARETVLQKIPSTTSLGSLSRHNSIHKDLNRPNDNLQFSLLINLDDNTFYLSLEYLRAKDILTLCQANKDLNLRCQHPIVWKNLKDSMVDYASRLIGSDSILQTIPTITHENEKINYFLFYKHLFQLISQTYKHLPYIPKTKDEYYNLQRYQTKSTQETLEYDNLNCCIVACGKIFDLTRFQFDHPGGKNILDEWNGKDATLPYLYSNHSRYALQESKRYIIWSDELILGCNGLPNFVPNKIKRWFF